MFVNLNKKLDNLNYEEIGRKAKKRSPSKRIWLSILGIFVVLLVISSVLMYLGIKDLKKNATLLTVAYQNQNFDGIKSGVGGVKGSLQKIDVPLNIFFWVRFIPIIGGYFGDTKSLVEAGIDELNAIQKLLIELEPAKSELGFNNTPIAGQDRITQAMKILDKALPKLDLIQPDLEKGALKVKDIDVEKYPDTFRGVKVKLLFKTAKNFIVGASLAVKENRDALALSPQALGQSQPKNYLLLFQNDKEIRATGGFMTAFADLKLDKGQISTSTSDDIYRLDEQLLKVCLNVICPLTPPAPIVRYLPEADGKPRKAWSLRDSNLSPDLPTSAADFERIYRFLGNGLPFDGIIYIDTRVVEELIDITGPIEVYGTKYSSAKDPRCDCPNVIYELENYAEVAAKGEKDRKAVLGVLMQQILARSIGAEVTKLPELIETIVSLANQKHVMFYMHDLNTQQALSKVGWTGEIKQYDGDYLHINDSNFAGGKSNLYVYQKISQDISVGKNGQTHKKLSIEYKNDQPFSTWLNGINRDYVRVYVPKGSKLTSSKGSEDVVQTFDDLGKTYFAAFVTVRPQNSRVLSFEYDIPYSPTGEYKLLIQKQPGAQDFQHKLQINGRPQTPFNLIYDSEFKFKI